MLTLRRFHSLLVLQWILPGFTKVQPLQQLGQLVNVESLGTVSTVTVESAQAPPVPNDTEGYYRELNRCV